MSSRPLSLKAQLSFPLVFSAAAAVVFLLAVLILPFILGSIDQEQEQEQEQLSSEKGKLKAADLLAFFLFFSWNKHWSNFHWQQQQQQQLMSPLDRPMHQSLVLSFFLSTLILTGRLVKGATTQSRGKANCLPIHLGSFQRQQQHHHQPVFDDSITFRALSRTSSSSRPHCTVYSCYSGAAFHLFIRLF